MSLLKDAMAPKPGLKSRDPVAPDLPQEECHFYNREYRSRVNHVAALLPGAWTGLVRDMLITLDSHEHVRQVGVAWFEVLLPGWAIYSGYAIKHAPGGVAEVYLRTVSEHPFRWKVTRSAGEAIRGESANLFCAFEAADRALSLEHPVGG